MFFSLLKIFLNCFLNFYSNFKDEMTKFISKSKLIQRLNKNSSSIYLNSEKFIKISSFEGLKQDVRDWHQNSHIRKNLKEEKLLLLFECLFSLLRFFCIAIKRARFVQKYYSTLGTFHQFFIFIARSLVGSFCGLLHFFNFDVSSLIWHFLRLTLKHVGLFFAAACQNL